MDFSICYRRLALDQECDWQQARRRYQALVAAHHPDRGGNHQTLAEINQAWHALQVYYRQHQRMPLATEAADGKGVSGPPFTMSSPMTAPARLSRRWPLLLLLAALVLVWQWSPQPAPLARQPAVESPSPPVAEPSPWQTQGAVSGWIAGGEPMGWVVERLGPPDDIVDDRWYYRSSWIAFRDGRVSEWNSTVDHPLPTRTLQHAH